MLHEAPTLYVLAFDIDEFERLDIDKMPNVVNTFADLIALNSGYIFEFKEFENFMNTSQKEQDPKIDWHWWKMVYVLDEGVSLHA